MELIYITQIIQDYQTVALNIMVKIEGNLYMILLENKKQEQSLNMAAKAMGSYKTKRLYR